MYEKLLNYPDALEEIILYTTLLSNNCSNIWKEDCKKIISFISFAYNIFDLKDDLFSLIIDEISNLSIFDEYNGIKSLREYSDNFTTMDLFYDLKGHALEKIASMAKILQEKDSSLFYILEFNTTTIYEPNLRFKSLLKISSIGILEINTMLGLMYACGIGCNKNPNLAYDRLQKSSFYADKGAMLYISKILDDKKLSNTYKCLYELSNKYLYLGTYTITPEDNLKYPSYILDIFSIIFKIYTNITSIYGKLISFQFLEIILSNKISYEQKIYFINNYSKGEWRCHCS